MIGDDARRCSAARLAARARCSARSGGTITQLRMAERSLPTSEGPWALSVCEAMPRRDNLRNAGAFLSPYSRDIILDGIAKLVNLVSL